MLLRSRPSACTATSPPVMKNDACRSKSRIWKFAIPGGGFGGIEWHGLPLGRLRTAGQQPEPPCLVARARDLGHVVAGELLVAGARPRAVVVARRDEAEAEASRCRRIVEVRDGERVLRRGARAVVEGRVEAIAALATVLPVLDRGPGHGRTTGRAGVQVVAPRVRDATLALRRRRVAAARAHDLARLPAARGVARGRFRADRRTLGVVGDLLEAAVLLRVPVAGVHLDQGLAIGIVRRGELLVPARARRRVEAPRVAVRDDDRVEAPLPELLEQLVRRERHLAAVLRQLARVDADGTGRRRRELVLELAEVEVALAVRPVEDGKADAAARGWGDGGGRRSGCDRGR